jgi:hypothetical protein
MTAWRMKWAGDEEALRQPLEFGVAKLWAWRRGATSGDGGDVDWWCSQCPFCRTGSREVVARLWQWVAVAEHVTAAFGARCGHGYGRGPRFLRRPFVGERW